MSTFQKKYYYDFKSVEKKTHTVEIWQDISSGISATKVIGAADPFIVTMPSLENKFQPVRGTGADLNLFATSSMQFMDLYTANTQEYQVRHYIDGAKNWVGYLDTEIFSSDFSRSKNYSVSMTANDGFALLDRLYYVQSDGSQYTGLSTQFDILKVIYSKINLPYEYTYIGLSTSVTGVTPATSETILHKTYVTNSNFYDEDGTALTLREVLESILKPYGAFMVQDEANIYITDIQSYMAGATISFKRYYSNLNTYIDTVNVNTLITDLATIGFASSDQTLNIIPAFNKEVVKYSPYKTIDILDYNAEEDHFTTVNASTAYGSTGFKWMETFYDTSDTFDRITLTRAFFIKEEGLDDSNADVIDYYLKLQNNSVIQAYNYNSFTPGYHSYTCKKTLPALMNSGESYGLKVELKVYPRFLNDLNNSSETSTEVINQLVLFADIQIGSQHYVYAPPRYGPTTYWQSSGYAFIDINERSNDTTIGANPYNNIRDKWTDLKTWTYYFDGTNTKFKANDYVIPLGQVTGGVLTFKIYGYSPYDWTTGSYVYNYCGDVRLKDIKLTIVDSLGKPINEEDTEYVGYMNPQYVNEGQEIDLIQGTNTTAYPIERGGMLKYDGTNYSWITQWTRATVTDNIENLLLRSFVGNYENKNLEIVATTKILPTNIGYLTYNTPSTTNGKKFMITSAAHDYANNKSDITMQEIFADSLTINKSF